MGKSIKDWLLVKIYNRFRKLRASGHLAYLKTLPGVTIAPSAKISEGVIIDTSGGGKVQIGERVELQYNVILMTYGGQIIIGNETSINPNTIIYGHGTTVIGNNVLIAGGCMIIPANHNFSSLDMPIGKQGLSVKGITIEDDVWIGHGCSILDGVTIGKGAVVAAGSVVNRNVEPYAVVGGVPCKLIKYRYEVGQRNI